MLCPKCKHEGKNVEMEVIETMRIGAVERVVKYKCPECEKEGFSLKRTPQTMSVHRKPNG